MGKLAKLAAWLRAASPAVGYSETAHLAGFVQTPTSPAPDAKPLVETEQASAIIARCVNVISADSAQVPLRLFDVRDPQRPVELHSHPAILLWRHINPVESPVIYTEQLYADLICEGNHFAWLDRDERGRPSSMIRIPPEQVKVIPHRTRIIAGYEHTRPDNQKIFYPADEIMHVRTRNPNPIYRGLGLLQRARDQIRFEYQLRSWKENQIKNGVPTSLIVKVKRPFFNDGDWERFREETWEKLRGIPNAGKPMFVKAEDVDVEVIPRPKEDEVAFIAALQYTRNEFAMLFGVPPSRLSDYSESFRANASEQGRTYWQDTIMSWHRLFLDYLNSTFIPRWYPEEVDAGMRPRIAFAYDYSQVRALALSMRDMATVNEILVRNALRTPNQATVSMGDARHEDEKADDLYMNGRPLGEEPQPLAGEQPGSRPSGGESRPGEEIEPETQEDEGRGAAGRGKGGGDGSRPRFVLRAVPGDIVNEKLERERMQKEVQGIIREMVRRAGEEEIDLSGLLAAFDMADPLVLQAVASQSFLMSQAVTNTTAIEVQRALALAIESGYDEDKMRKAVRATFRAARADWRLDRISRTESHQAHEGGGWHALRQSGVRRKEWVATNDENVRHDHRANHMLLDGDVRELSEPFVDPASRARLMYPGDQSGAVSGADVINCRCVKVANFSDLEEQALRRAMLPRKEIWTVKAATRLRFEGSLKLATRQFLKSMEQRALEELNRQLDKGAGRAVA